MKNSIFKASAAWFGEVIARLMGRRPCYIDTQVFGVRHRGKIIYCRKRKLYLVEGPGCLKLSRSHIYAGSIWDARREYFCKMGQWVGYMRVYANFNQEGYKYRLGGKGPRTAAEFMSMILQSGLIDRSTKDYVEQLSQRFPDGS